MGVTIPVSSLLQIQQSNVSMNDSTTYYYSINAYGTNGNLGRVYLPRAGVIKSCVVYWYNNVNCTAEDTTINIRVNDTSDALVYTGTFANAASPQANYSMSQQVSQGDYIHLTIVTPAWVTNPTGTYILAVIEVAY